MPNTFLFLFHYNPLYLRFTNHLSYCVIRTLFRKSPNVYRVYPFKFYFFTSDGSQTVWLISSVRGILLNRNKRLRKTEKFWENESYSPKQRLVGRKNRENPGINQEVWENKPGRLGKSRNKPGNIGNSGKKPGNIGEDPRKSRNIRKSGEIASNVGKPKPPSVLIVYAYKFTHLYLTSWATRG